MFFREVLFLCAILLPWTSAYPNGAGGCSGVQGSVGGTHLNPPTDQAEVESSSLEDAGLFVTSDSANGASAFTLTSSAPFPLTAGEPYTLNLTVGTSATQGYFLGYLFRIAASDSIVASQSTDATSPLDTSGALMVDPNFSRDAQVAAPCISSGLGGVTHTSSAHKAYATSILQLYTPGTYELQVTAVLENDYVDAGYESKWAFSSYKFSVSDAFASDASMGSGGQASQKISLPQDGGSGGSTIIRDSWTGVPVLYLSLTVNFVIVILFW